MGIEKETLHHRMKQDFERCWEILFALEEENKSLKNKIKDLEKDKEENIKLQVIIKELRDEKYEKHN